MSPISDPPPEPTHTPPADPELDPIEKMVASGGWPNIFFGD